MKTRVGLTGGIASGKSLVADMLARRGAVVIDTDVLARAVVEPGTDGFEQVVSRFGPGMVGADGSLDRARLGEAVFADPAALADLNAVVHPLVAAEQWRLDGAASDGSVVVHVVPLLVETGQAALYDEVVVVDADEATQLHRLMGRSALTEPQARARLNAQATRQQRLSKATQVIDNTGPISQTRAQVDALWQALTNQPTENVGGAL